MCELASQLIVLTHLAEKWLLRISRRLLPQPFLTFRIDLLRKQWATCATFTAPKRPTMRELLIAKERRELSPSQRAISLDWLQWEACLQAGCPTNPPGRFGKRQTILRSGIRPFSLMMGVRKRAFSGVFIEENAHRSRSPCLHLQGKWSRTWSLGSAGPGQSGRSSTPNLSWNLPAWSSDLKFRSGYPSSGGNPLETAKISPAAGRYGELTRTAKQSNALALEKKLIYDSAIAT